MGDGREWVGKGFELGLRLGEWEGEMDERRGS